MKARSKAWQDGVSLSGLIMVLIVLGLVAVIGMKVFPTVTEFLAVKKAIVTSRGAGSPSEIRKSFTNTANIENIESMNAKDLVIVKTGEGYDVSFQYERRIPLFGPVNLLMDYQGTTAANGVVAKKTANSEETGR
jgi:hypothetical protein